MELSYLYIKQCRNFSNTELNFSQEVYIHYDVRKRVLTASKKENVLPNDFWGKNINSLTMIVGNNGAGKTSIMQCVISAFQNLLEQEKFPDDCIVVLREDTNLYCFGNISDGIEVRDGDGLRFERSAPSEIYDVFRKSKIIYLTNALSLDDVKRCQQKYYGRDNFLYDCSIGGLVSSDSRLDVNGEVHKHKGEFSETETYFQYEQYKQIKFVFDRNQYKILKDMKAEHYPVPLPEKLYIELLTESQLEYFFNDSKISDEIEKNCFGKKLSKLKGLAAKFSMAEIKSLGNEIKITCGSQVLPYILCRSCLWGMIRSIARRMDFEQRQYFGEKISHWVMEEGDQEREFCEVSDKIWEISEQVVGRNFLDLRSDWEDFSHECKPCYNSFFQYIEANDRIAYDIEVDIQELLQLFTSASTSITLTVSTTKNPDWFIDFVKRYRYVANPDYFLNFHWDLSSGENNLLSTFASFYYIFGADYTDKRKGMYKIYNKWENKELTKCDSIILLADEADLTYHPEWQREYISLLTAFLVRVYPPSCCQNIQIILSTHSPILLGDVPQQNVIYLRKDESGHSTKVDTSVQIETFGQNVLLLLQNSFFLENGTMGKFAYNKINNIYNNLSKLERDIDRILDEGDPDKQTGRYAKRLEIYRQYADLIGEQIIRRRLNSQIERIGDKLFKKEAVQHLSDEVLEERMRVLQAEISRRKLEKESDR